MSNQDVIELRWIFAVIRRWSWLIVGCMLFAAAIAFAYVSAMPPTYEATATLLVQPVADQGTNEYNTLVAGERLALTYSEMLTGQPVLEAVIQQMGLRETPNELAAKIKVEPVKNTQLLRVSVTGSTPIQAALLANTVSEVFTAHIGTLQAEQYNESLRGLQDQMDTLMVKMEQSQSDIQTLSAKKIGVDADLARLENLLQDDRTSYRDLQKDYQSLQISVAQLSDTVRVYEAARASDGAGSNLATVTLLYDQSLLAGASNFSATTYGKMLVGRPVFEAAIAKVGLDMNADALALKVRTASIPNTQLVTLSVVDNDASRATLLADAIAAAFIDQVRSLQLKPYTDQLDGLKGQMDTMSAQIAGTQSKIASLTTDSVEAESEISNQENLLAGYRSDYRARQQDYEQLQLTAAKAADTVVITEPAPVPERPVQRHSLYIILAAVVGAFGALGVAFLLEYTTDLVRTSDDVTQAIGLSTLGKIGHVAGPEDGLIVNSQPRSPEAEAFRVLATNIRFTGLDRPLRTILVTSSYPQEGKSMVVANLSAALAQRDLKVVVVDADLRMPRLHKLFKLDPGEGLTGCLLGGNVDVNLKHVDMERLMVLPSGDLPPNPAEVLASPRMRTLLEELASKADLVLIDCPPVLPVADATILASMVDGVLLVLQADHTRRQALREATENLRNVGGRLVGVVLNGITVRGGNYSRYYGDKNNKPTTSQPSMRHPIAYITQFFNSLSDHRNGNVQSTSSPNGLKQAVDNLKKLFKKSG